MTSFIFRAPNDVNKELMNICNKSKRMHMIPSIMDGKYALRVVVMDEYCKEEHILEVWRDIQRFARRVLLRREELHLGKKSVMGENFDPIVKINGIPL